MNTLVSRSRRVLGALSLGLVLSGTFGGVALAGPGGHHADGRDYNRSVNGTVDDRQDLMALSGSVNEWHRARLRADRWMELDADHRIQAYLGQELAESRREVMFAQGEVARARAELKKATADLRRDLAHGYDPNYTGSQARYNQSLAQLQDEERDAAYKRADMNRVEALTVELGQMQPAFEAGYASVALYQRKSLLYRQVQGDALAELGINRGEVYEDAVALGAVPPSPPPPVRPMPPAPYRGR